MKLLLLAVAFLGMECYAQQVPDTLYQAPLPTPRFEKGTGPVVLIDEAHFNFHTAEGRFRPFAMLLQRDGYRIRRGTVPFQNQALEGVQVLVISNALHERNQGDWSLPNPSAFTDEEIENVRAWVEKGGALFLIADHMPFPGCNEKLAAAFGFKFYNGFAMAKRGDGPDLFCRANGRLTTAPFSIDSVYSFTGQAFDVPPAAQVLLHLDDSFEVLLPNVAWEFDKNTPRVEAKGKAQGATLSYGKGRVVVFGEAAMFSAQLSGNSRVGFNHRKATNNAPFLLELMHWLAP